MAENKLTLKVTGMTGDHAAETVLSTLSAVPGAKFAEMSAKDGTATVEYDDSEASPQDFVEAIDAAGFGVEWA
jgi:copper chaperone CopZ